MWSLIKDWWRPPDSPIVSAVAMVTERFTIAGSYLPYHGVLNDSSSVRICQYSTFKVSQELAVKCRELEARIRDLEDKQ